MANIVASAFNQTKTSVATLWRPQKRFQQAPTALDIWIFTVVSKWSFMNITEIQILFEDAKRSVHLCFYKQKSYCRQYPYDTTSQVNKIFLIHREFALFRRKAGTYNITNRQHLSTSTKWARLSMPLSRSTETNLTKTEKFLQDTIQANRTDTIVCSGMLVWEKEKKKRLRRRRKRERMKKKWMSEWKESKRTQMRYAWLEACG